MIPVLETRNLGKRYGKNWALRDCTLELPAGKVAALVGPNGAGKTTLLHLAIGLTQATVGEIKAFGWSPRDEATIVLSRIGFVAQDRPLYDGFTVDEMLEMGRKLNQHWDGEFAKGRIRRLHIPANRKVGKLSGGQKAQVALVMALAKRPELLLLDEPVAALDPLARREFLSSLMEATAEAGLTVLLSSHILADLERVCDYLIILSESRVQLTGEIDDLLENHKLLTGPSCSSESVANVHNVVQARHTPRQTNLLIRVHGHVHDASWEMRDVGLEEVVLAYMGREDSSLEPFGDELNTDEGIPA